MHFFRDYYQYYQQNTFNMHQLISIAVRLRCFLNLDNATQWHVDHVTSVTIHGDDGFSMEADAAGTEGWNKNNYDCYSRLANARLNERV